jgi:hypothetical protein
MIEATTIGNWARDTIFPYYITKKNTSLGLSCKRLDIHFHTINILSTKTI